MAKRQRLKPSNANSIKRGCFAQTMVQPTNNVPTRAMALAMATTTMAMATATAMAAINNPDLGVNINQTQLSVRRAITVRKRITSRVIATKGREMKHPWSKLQW